MNLSTKTMTAAILLTCCAPALVHTPAANAGNGPPHEIRIIEDSGFFGVPGINQGTVATIMSDNPTSAAIIGEAGGRLGPFNWGGIAFSVVTGELLGFENTTMSVRAIDAATNSNTLIDSVGHVDSGVAGFALSNDGTVAYCTGVLSAFGRVIRADAATGEILSVHNFLSRVFSALAVLPEGTDLPYDPGTVFAIVNVSGGKQLHTLDFDTNTTVNLGSIIPLGFIAAFDSGLDFAPDGTLYAAIGGFLAAGPDISSRLYTLNPMNGAATLLGVIGDDNAWDVAGIAVVRDTLVAGDINGDGTVDLADLLILLSTWGPCAEGAPCPADLTGDGEVDLADLLFLLSAWS